MHILSLLTYYAPHWTGLSRYAQLHAEGLAARGHQVSVVTSRHDPQLPARQNLNGVDVWRLPILGRLSRGQIMPGLPVALGMAIRRADIVQMHTPMLEAALVAALCRAQKKPLVMTHHGDLQLPRSAFNTLTRAGVVSQMTLAGHSADAVVNYSLDYARHSPFLSQFGDHLHIIAPPVEIPEPNTARVRAWKAELGLENRRIVGFAGRFVEEKGFDFLLRAIPAILERIPDAHFVFAGDLHVAYEQFWAQNKPLWNQNSEHLTSLGLLRDAQKLADFYAMCDVFAFPSRSDCYGLVQAEAMCCGAPVVAPDLPGARVPVRETGAGRLFEPQNIEDLGQALIDVIENRARFAPDAAAMRSHFGTARTLDAYETLYNQVLEGQTQLRTFATTPVTSAQASIAPVVAREADMAFRRRALRLIEWLDPRPGERILDCGCGAGFYVSALSARCPEAMIVGMDDDLVRLQRIRAEEGRAKRAAHVARGDALRLPFGDGCFDKILLSEVLEHLRDDQAALRELWRVLKPGGYLAISVPHARYPFVWDPINRTQIALGGAPFREGPLVGIWTYHERLYEPAHLEILAREANFEIEALEVATHSCAPLEHFLLYGVGKTLLENALLPAKFAREVDRFESEAPPPSGAFKWGLKWLRACDRRNDDNARPTPKTFVNVLMLARKPI